MRLPSLSCVHGPARSSVPIAASFDGPELVSRRLLLAASTLLVLEPVYKHRAHAYLPPAGKVEVLQVPSAALDRRTFRGLRLPNGLRVLLCSDPETTKGAASMNVEVGSLSNPKEWPGLAHFCEHMLFLGTERYPGEGEFEKYISANGGSNNAFTAGEDTCYFFDVNGDGLSGGLTRFADFFRSPLFTESGTAREVDAIDSEHSKNLQSDFWRSDAVLRLRARRDHPYSRFATGNRATLRGGSLEARAALKDFYTKYYRAQRMQLAVQGPQDLDELQKIVVREFASLPSYASMPVPRASDAYDALPPPFEQGSPAEPYATLVVPVREARSLTLTWCLPVDDVDEWLRTKPEAFVLLLLSNRGQSGLNKYLRAEGLANSVDGTIDEFTRTWVLVTVYVDLTEKGLAEWSTVATAIFSYLRAMSEAGIPPHVFSDARRMRQLAFEYGEPSSPQSFVQAAAGSIAGFAPEQWLTGPILIEAGAEARVGQILQQMKPSTAIVKLTAQELKPLATQTEGIYGALYGTMPIAAQVAKWEAPPRIAGFAPPRANPFVPTNLAIKSPRQEQAAGVRVTPKLLLRAPGVRLHFLQDRRFGRPKAFVFLALRSSALYTDAAVSIRAELYQALLADALQDVAYEAQLGGLGAGAGVSWQGLTLSLSGYDQRLPELAGTVASSLRSFDMPPQAFKRRRDQLCRQLRNAAQRQPIQICAYQRNLALQTPRYSNEALLAAAEKVTLAEVKALQAGLLPELELEAFVCGNMVEAEAKAVVQQLQSALPAKPLPRTSRPERRVRRLPSGATLQQFVAANPDEENSGVEIYFQVGPDQGDDWVLLTLLSQMLAKAYYTELRTRQQIGYIVQCNANEIDGVRGLSFLAQVGGFQARALLCLATCGKEAGGGQGCWVRSGPHVHITAPRPSAFNVCARLRRARSYRPPR